jgi:hypothetical protein
MSGGYRLAEPAGLNHLFMIGFCPLFARVNCKRERRDVAPRDA